MVLDVVVAIAPIKGAANRDKQCDDGNQSPNTKLMQDVHGGKTEEVSSGINDASPSDAVDDL